MPGEQRHWGSVILAGLCALTTLAAVDAALHLVAPPKPLLEIDEAMDGYEAGDPTVLAIGSSHARSFIAVDRALSQRTGGTQHILSVPVEWGKYTPYAWVMQHRVKPILEETDASGALVRDSLRQVLIVTEWWDSTSLDPGTGSITMALPARAWQWTDFLADALENGLTPYNQNFLQRIWRERWSRSSLVQDRGYGNITRGIKEALRGKDVEGEKASYVTRLKGWQSMVEEGVDRLFDPDQVRSLEEIIDYFKGRGIAVTIVLYPRMPGTLSQKAKDTTLRQFSARMNAFAQEHLVRFVDLTLRHPLTDDDFETDFDHITPEGNRRLAEWVLDRDLAFLVDGAGRDTAGSPTAGNGGAQ
jgi:hypothetical protein